MYKIRNGVAVFIFVLFTYGCAGMQVTSGPSGPSEDDQFGTSFMAYTIKERLRKPRTIGQPMVVTTFVDLNNLSKSSVFGRVMAEQLLNKLHEAGFTVSELRKGKDIFMRQELGEMILSRDAHEVLNKSTADAVLAGTYVATSDSVIINARLLAVNSPLVLSSCSYRLKMTKELEKLLTGESPF
ncbi:hypothetical protein MNBD_NITROSPINAE04-559 [hydrothermal vent metagenome]|uniref:FlgO domain-containing protein n=1 Tax=hydrothermal vent metagenome TaxID=652676 RepID=A0A3B1C0X7_9ZZZZ